MGRGWLRGAVDTGVHESIGQRWRGLFRRRLCPNLLGLCNWYLVTLSVAVGPVGRALSSQAAAINIRRASSPPMTPSFGTTSRPLNPNPLL